MCMISNCFDKLFEMFTMKQCFLRMLAAQKTFLKAQNGMNVLSHKILGVRFPFEIFSALLDIAI